MTRIRFLGGAGTVTGSKYLVETGRSRLLIDCGLFQGYKNFRQLNWDALPFDAASLDAVLLTHAHIDHSGYLPRLVKLGFKGRVYCTDGTRDLLRILLPDSGHLQEEDARRANKYRYSRHHPAEPLYTTEDAERSLSQLSACKFAETFEPASGVTATFTRAGHIIGSACLALRVGGTTITFSGDVGRPNDPVMKPPSPLGPTDYLIIESTYGDRLHPPEDVAEELARIVNEAVEKRGVILVPSFAVGRSQHMLHVIAQLQEARRIPKLPVFLNSPMAIDATNVFCNHKDDHRLGEGECKSMCRTAKYTRTVEESKAIDQKSGPMIVIAANGMGTGGRILHHFRRFLPDERNTVLFVGYQAAGTRGRALLDGADTLRIHGQEVPVRARVAQVEGLSAHADYAELIEWLSLAGLSPKKAFVTHGEPASADELRKHLRDAFGWETVAPHMGTVWDLD